VVAGGAAGTVAFIGSVTGSVDLGTGPLPNAGNADILIALIDPP